MAVPTFKQIRKTPSGSSIRRPVGNLYVMFLQFFVFALSALSMSSANQPSRRQVGKPASCLKRADILHLAVPFPYATC